MATTTENRFTRRRTLPGSGHRAARPPRAPSGVVHLAGRLLLGLVAVACASPPPAAETPPSTSTPAVPKGEAARYFPAPDGYVYAYDTRALDTGERGVLMLQVRRPRPSRIEVTSGGKVERLVESAEGVAYVAGGWLVRAPLVVGATFPGKVGMTRISAVDTHFTSPAGSFVDCLTLEERAESPGGFRSVRSVLCRDVGLVSLTVEAAMRDGTIAEEATLRSFGPRVDIGAPPVP